MWITIVILLILVIVLSGLMTWLLPPDDGTIHISENPNNEPMVRIHYGWEVGTTIVIVPTSEIMRYTRDFSILSIEPYIEEDNKNSD